MASKRKASVGKDCVACGACAKCCPFGAISIVNGISAVVDESKCVGCGKCAIACPGDVIQIVFREANKI